jgi:hypothetical protein
MAAMFDLAALGAIVVVLLLVGWGAATAGAETRPGFSGETDRFPEHHNSWGSF